MVIVVSGSSKEEVIFDLPIKEQFKVYVKEGLTDMEAIKRITKERGLKKQDVYREVKIKE